MTEQQPYPFQQPLPAKPTAHAGVTVGLLILAVVGLVMNQQSVSVASGSGVVWMGFVLTIAATVIAFVVPNVPSWVKVVLLIIAVIAFGSAIYVEHELAQRRREIQDILSNLGGY